MIHESICNATVYNNDSEESKADIMVQENVSGATVSENIYNDDGPIKYSFVQTECHINLEKEVKDRKTMLDSVFNQLYPKNDNFEDDFNPPDLDYDINKSKDGASNRQNEVSNTVYNVFLRKNWFSFFSLSFRAFSFFFFFLLFIYFFFYSVVFFNRFLRFFFILFLQTLNLFFLFINIFRFIVLFIIQERLVMNINNMVVLWKVYSYLHMYLDILIVDQYPQINYNI